jgi:hypothetical protein
MCRDQCIGMPRIGKGPVNRMGLDREKLAQDRARCQLRMIIEVHCDGKIKDKAHILKFKVEGVPVAGQRSPDNFSGRQPR